VSLISYVLGIDGTRSSYLISSTYDGTCILKDSQFKVIRTEAQKILVELDVTGVAQSFGERSEV
jgi:hypothetical protein